MVAFTSTSLPTGAATHALDTRLGGSRGFLLTWRRSIEFFNAVS
jgi:hypothetical protein